jgi:DNA-binding MarR family transcriptional regulator
MREVAPSTDPSVTGAAVRTLARLARLLEHACEQLTLPQYRLLAMVASGDERATQLAGRLTLSKPTVTAVVDGLVERGMLVRSEVTGDRRAGRVSLSPAGQNALVATEAAMSERLAGVRARCDDPEQARSGLAQLGQALERAVAERMAETGR